MSCGEACMCQGTGFVIWYLGDRPPELGRCPGYFRSDRYDFGPPTPEEAFGAAELHREKYPSQEMDKAIEQMAEAFERSLEVPCL